MIRYKWKCPFCDATGKTEWNKDAHHVMHEHIAGNHLEEGYQAILAKRTKEMKTNMVKNTWIYSGNIEETNELIKGLQNRIE